MSNPFPYPQPSTAPAPGMEALLEPVAGVALAGDCREPGRLLAEIGRGQAEVPRGFWFNGRVELKHMFGVDKGDTVKLSVKAYYENDPATDAMLSAAEMLAQILMGAEGGPAAGEGASVSNSTLDESAVAAMNANKSASAQEDVPKAFLNYMFFDEDMTFVTSGFVQITGAAKNLWENVAFANPIVIEENGYFLTYVSNETNAASVVDFDDLTVTHSKTPIVQVDDYYPFGLTFNSFTRSYSTPQRYKYNGKEEQEEWGVLDFEARMYDSWLGRFTTMDPHTESYYSISAYSSFANNPMKFIDPTGRDILYWQYDAENEKWNQVGYDKLDEKTQKALETFAKTKAGNAFISQFAKKGDKVGEVEFTEDGKFAQHNWNFGEYQSIGNEGYTDLPIGDDFSGPYVDPGKVNFYTNINTNMSNDSDLNMAETIGHEVFLHLDPYIPAYLEAFEENGSQGVYNEGQKNKKENYKGYKDHLAQGEKSKFARKYYEFVNQLKSVFNPSSVQRHVEKERKKNYDAGKRHQKRATGN